MFPLVIKFAGLLMLVHGIKTSTDYSIDNGAALLALGFLADAIVQKIRESAKAGE